MKLLPLKPPAIDLKFVIRYLKTAYEMKYAWNGMITRAGRAQGRVCGDGVGGALHSSLVMPGLLLSRAAVYGLVRIWG